MCRARACSALLELHSNSRRRDPFEVIVGQLLEQIDGALRDEPVRVSRQRDEFGHERRVALHQPPGAIGPRDAPPIAARQERPDAFRTHDERWYFGWQVPHHTASSTLNAFSVALSIPPTDVKPVANRFTLMCSLQMARPQNLQIAFASLSQSMHFMVPLRSSGIAQPAVRWQR
jgi:hypothetical protein